MRKFKVGDKVILTAPDPTSVLFDFKGRKGEVIYVEPDDHDGLMVYQIFIKDNINGDRYFWVEEDWISFDPDHIKNQIPKMTDDEIYDILKPKMEKMGIDSNGAMTAVTMNDYGTAINHYMLIEDVKRLVATAYRSGYGRGQKGRPFVIGEKKKPGGHWVPCEHEENLAPGTKLRRNNVKFNDGDYAIQEIPVGTEVEVLNGYEDFYVHVTQDNIWISFPGGNNGENEKTYKKFHDLTGYYVIHVGKYTEYFDKWVEE